MEIQGKEEKKLKENQKETHEKEKKTPMECF